MTSIGRVKLLGALLAWAIAFAAVDGHAQDAKFFRIGTGGVGGTYKGVGETPTISVNALWIVTAAADDELVYRITKALWNAQTRKLLDGGHAKGRLITIDTALDGIGIPLHKGAERYYREAGKLN